MLRSRMEARGFVCCMIGRNAGASEMGSTYTPLRTLQDVEALERVPLGERIFSWNLNDWIAQGCARDPGKIAIRYIADGDPDREPVAISYGELRLRAFQAANLFRSFGVTSDDVVLYVL